MYPSEFSIKSSVSVNVTNGVLQENLSDLELSYDNYLKERLESFIYVRRLSDKFMSIDNRYEVGAGIVLEDRKKLRITDSYVSGYTAGDNDAINAEKKIIYNKLTPAGQKAFKSLELYELKNEGWLKNFLKKHNLTDYEIDNFLKLLSLDRDKKVNNIQNNHRKFRHAWLFGVFAEVEQSSLNETRELVRDTIFRADREPFILSDEVELKKTLNAQTIGRLVVRPTFDWRGENFSFLVRPYLKLPLEFWRNKNIVTESGATTSRYDWRFEGSAILSIKGGPVTTNISYTYYYDNLPSRDFIAPGLGFDQDEFVMANLHHHVVNLNFSYSF